MFRYNVPEFTSQGNGVSTVHGFIRAAGRLKQLGDEVPVHSDIAGVSVQVTGRKFNGLTEHYAKGYLPETQFVRYGYRIPYLVAVLDKALAWKGWIIVFKT